MCLKCILKVKTYSVFLLLLVILFWKYFFPYCGVNQISNVVTVRNHIILVLAEKRYNIKYVKIELKIQTWAHEF